MGNGITTTSSTYISTISCNFNGVVSGADFIRSLTIGEGGFSKVVACMHHPSKTWMAVKETSIVKACGGKLGLSALEAEVRILSLIADDVHPFIVNLHFAFQDGMKCFIALDLHPGGDLRYHIRNKKAHRERTVAFYAICLSSALHYLHERGILHRDVKPENVILDAAGYPYLTDFGVSSLSDTSAELLSHCSSGTRQYLAPEVFTKSHRHGVEADFWSLGVMLFEIVYGYRPFKEHCPMNMIYFVEDLQEAGIHLSSTSYRFTTGNMKPRDAKSAISHADHVAATIASSGELSGQLRSLKKEASVTAIKSLLPPHTYDPKGFIVEPKASQGIFPVRDVLPQSHRPVMPKANNKNKPISVACVAFLEGLMDVRLWERLGAGANYDTLQNHAWFREQKLVWSEVLEQKVVPTHVPNLDRISRELQFKFGNDNDCYSACSNQATPTLNLCTRDEVILKEFHFVARKYELAEEIADQESEDSVSGSDAHLDVEIKTDDAVLANVNSNNKSASNCTDNKVILVSQSCKVPATEKVKQVTQSLKEKVALKQIVNRRDNCRPEAGNRVARSVISQA